MGRTPGFLSTAIKQKATSVETLTESTYAEHYFLAVKAMELQKSSENDENDVHIHFQLMELSPDGPVTLSIPRTVSLIRLPPNWSKEAKCGSWSGGRVGGRRI